LKFCLFFTPEHGKINGGLTLTFLTDTLLSADENEISDGVYDDLTAADADREAFFTLFNNLLWDADDSSDDADTASGRQYMYRRKGKYTTRQNLTNRYIIVIYLLTF
jgi:hypothetical protein